MFGILFIKLLFDGKEEGVDINIVCGVVFGMEVMELIIVGVILKMVVE